MYSETRPRGRARMMSSARWWGATWETSRPKRRSALAPTLWPRPLERRILQNTVGDCSRGQAARGHSDYRPRPGSERGRWGLQSCLMAEAADGTLISDHEYVVLRRQSRPESRLDDGDIDAEHRAPRHKHSSWHRSTWARFAEIAKESYEALLKEEGNVFTTTGDGAGATRWNAIARIVNTSADAATAEASQRIHLREVDDEAQVRSLAQQEGQHTRGTCYACDSAARVYMRGRSKAQQRSIAASQQHSSEGASIYILRDSSAATARSSRASRDVQHRPKPGSTARQQQQRRKRARRASTRRGGRAHLEGARTKMRTGFVVKVCCTRVFTEDKVCDRTAY